MTFTWKAPSAVTATLEQIAQARADELKAKPSAATALALCFAAGRLSFAEQVEPLEQIRAGLSAEVRSVLSEAVSAIDWDALEEGAIELSLMSDGLPYEGSPTDRRRIEELLDRRDDLECALEGVHQLGAEPELSVEREAALLTFDDAIAERHHRLTCLASVVEGKLKAVAPAHRQRLWWWYAMRDFTDQAYASLETAAQLISRFPAAREELERLVRAEADLERLTAVAPRRATTSHEKNVVSLADYIRRRAMAQVAAKDTSAVAIACADEEVTFHDHGKFVLSSTETDLLLDVAEQSQLPDHAPRVLVANQEPLVGEQVLPGRYRFPLSAVHFAAESASIEIVLDGDSISLKLPLEGPE